MDTVLNKLEGLQCKYPDPGGGEDIIWNGVEFIGKDKCFEVLRYPMPNQPSEWFDGELTDFLFSERHPIDKASLKIAIKNCLDYAASRLFHHQAGKRSDVICILEVGCSNGSMLRRLRKDLPVAEVCGADIISNTLQRLSRELKAEGIPTPIFQFDLTTCPFPDASFNIVVLLNVLEHIKEHEMAVAEVFRILKPGGIFVFEVPAGPDLYDTFDRELNHYRRYSKKEIEKILLMNGFVKMRLTYLGAIIYPVFYIIKRLRSRVFKARIHEVFCLHPVNMQDSGGLQEDGFTLRPEPGEANKKLSKISRILMKSSSSLLIDIIFNIELWLGKLISWPFGIRCSGVFYKPQK